MVLDSIVMIIDCLPIAKSFDAEIQTAIQRLRERGTTPRMCEVPRNPIAGHIVLQRHTKKRKANTLGIEYEAIHSQPGCSPGNEILMRISELNDDDQVHGILIGMPAYPHLDSEKLVAAIDASKGHRWAGCI